MSPEDGSRQQDDAADQSAKDMLFDGFREDHALMGKGFHRLAECLRGGEVDEAREAARWIDAEAGAHIAFEEHDVYPLLIPILGEDTVSEMFRDHREGRELIGRLCEGKSISEEECGELLARTEKFQGHIEECANLFGAVGRLESEHQQLQDCRVEWLRKRPRWTDLGE